jgi:hypothetical protein
MRMQIYMFFSYFLSIYHMFFLSFIFFGGPRGKAGRPCCYAYLPEFFGLKVPSFSLFNVCSDTDFAYDTTLIHLFFDMLGGGGGILECLLVMQFEVLR